ncbi:hypothetical protein A3A39_04580 [Candidatus Kaiserbacteria bacterium RIFCSPLOWO2_01_FULL_54_13]|uniref:DUF2268 domain-containing protein n=1 Tax=Candidatus Kaiserbacteria bacterium RIFCSPLOWO2_01_FULL_54_13 TaxID=1798512 RepID=A0A1F6F1M2_9BACT|nr:MAG: hypothetical protein A3A39_04580 [Candidatus Kaiserbacteria bacterium RIFCSPLOWO2_01_FULL_54_13]
MKVDVLFLRSDVGLTKKEKSEIQNALVPHVTKAAKALRYNPRVLTITIHPNWPRTDRQGMPAYTQLKDWIWIALNYKQFRSRKHHARLIERLKYLAYHEMHHAARGYAMSLPRKKFHVLLNSVVSEGLADMFALEQYPSEHIRSYVTYNEREAHYWFKKIKRMHQTEYPSSWLFGGHGKPKNVAYKVGRFVIAEAKRKHLKLNATKLLHMDYRRILRLAGIK